MLKRVFFILIVLVFLIAGCTKKNADTPSASDGSEASPDAVTAAPTSETVISESVYSEEPIQATWTLPGSADWQMTGQIGGTTKALLRDGDFLYLGVGLRVMVLNISNLKDIQVIGTSPLLPQFVESISSDRNGHIYVSCGSGGLVILNISIPSIPTISGYIDTLGFTEYAAAYGQYIVLADGPQGVQIVDISDVSNPVIISEAYSLAYAYDVSIVNDIAYIAAGGSGLLTVDLSDPNAPSEAGILSLDGFQYDVEARGDQLCAASAWGGMSVLNLTSPLTPTVAYTVATKGWAMALAMQDSSVLVMDGEDGAVLYDLSKGEPILISGLTTDGFMVAGTFDGSTAILLNKEKGLMIVDYSNPEEPKLSSSWLPLMEGRRVTMSGTTAYVAGGFNGVRVIDLSNANNPVETDWYDTDGGYANKLIADGNYLYLSSHEQTKYPFEAFDISDPLHLKRVGGISIFEPSVFACAIRSIILKDGYVYGPSETCNLSIDVTDPRKPAISDRVDGLNNPINADVSGNLLATVGGQQLQLMDISNPSDMKLLAVMEINSIGEAVAFLDPATLLLSAQDGIWTVDVSDPSNPKKTSSLAISGNIMSFYVDDKTVYMCTLGNGIQIVDVSNPNNLSIIGTVPVLGIAYDCFVQGDLMLVTDSFAGLCIYQKMTGNADSDTANLAVEAYDLPLKLNGSATVWADTQRWPIADPGIATTVVVTSAADSGPGTLREALANLQKSTTITFDPKVFSANKPTRIILESTLPDIKEHYLTIDASDAGVILDGSKLSEGNGLNIYSSYDKIMGLEIVSFPGNGIVVYDSSTDTQIGGNRNIGAGPVGQGNLVSGNGFFGILNSGLYQVIQGNLLGTDVTGTEAFSNHYGLMVNGSYITVGGTEPGTGNVISGNSWYNTDSFGYYNHILGNIIGLDITGTKAVNTESQGNLAMEGPSRGNIVGGTTPEERNIIGGANYGVIFSDANSYSNSLIGNYIGTDITGMKAVPNGVGVLLWSSANHRVGGMAVGEANLISGNQKGIELNGYGVTDNLIIGNKIGVDSNGKNTLPNIYSGIDLSMGQKHTIIGGYTSAEGNLISGSPFSIHAYNAGTIDNFIAGNTILGTSVAGLFLDDNTSRNFIQCNTFMHAAESAIRIDYGNSNEIRANTFDDTTGNAISLFQNANGNLAAPLIEKADSKSVSGTTCAGGLVEVYIVENGSLTSLGFTRADIDGIFVYQSSLLLDGKQIALLVTDTLSNTSAFSPLYDVKS